MQTARMMGSIRAEVNVMVLYLEGSANATLVAKVVNSRRRWPRLPGCRSPRLGHGRCSPLAAPCAECGGRQRRRDADRRIDLRDDPAIDLRLA